MMECLTENSEDPEALLVQVVRLYAHILARLREVATSMRVRGRGWATLINQIDAT
jgi:hypothetical protein